MKRKLLIGLVILFAAPVAYYHLMFQRTLKFQISLNDDVIIECEVDHTFMTYRDLSTNIELIFDDRPYPGFDDKGVDIYFTADKSSYILEHSGQEKVVVIAADSLSEAIDAIIEMDNRITVSYTRHMFNFLFFEPFIDWNSNIDGVEVTIVQN